MDQIKFQTQLAIDVIVVEHDKLMRHVEAQAQSVAQALETMSGVNEDIDFGDLADPGDAPGEDVAANAEVDDAPVVRFLQKLLLDAIGEGASDLHFEPYEKFYRVRFRLDGQMREVAQPPLAIKERLSTRIKVLVAARYRGKARSPRRANENCAVRDSARSIFASVRCRRYTVKKS